MTSALPVLLQAKPVRGFNQRTGVRRNDDSPLATKLEHDLLTSSGVTRWLYWLDAVEKATLPDFPRLARLARGNSIAMRFVTTRWIEIDPRHLFDALIASLKERGGLPVNELAMQLFQEWPKRDPEGVIAALSGADGVGLRHDWRKTVATDLVEQDVERGLRLMSEWHIDNVGPRMTAVAKWVAADPRHAAEFTLENPAGYASQLTMETIGKVWARTDPGAALEFAATEAGQLGSVLATAALKEWAGQNLSDAADWLAGADDRTRSLLSPAYVEIWARQDAANALAWCEQNLAGSSLAQAVGGVVKGVAEKDVAAAGDLVLAMNPSPARAEAASAVAQKWFPEPFSAKTGAPEPAAIAWVTGLDADSVKRVLERVSWQWSESDPKGMAAFLMSPAGEQVPAYIYCRVASMMARKSPLEALELASRLSETLGLTVGASAFSGWRQSQPEIAMKWLNELPSTDVRRQPFFRAAVEQMVYLPQAAEQLAAMTATDRAAARSVIEAMSLPEDRRAKLLDVLRQR